MDTRLAELFIDYHFPQNLAPAYAADVFKAGIESQRTIEISPNEI